MKKKITLLPALFSVIVTVYAQQPVNSPQESPQQSAAQSSVSNAYANSDLTYKIIDGPNTTFGYNVFVDGRLVIHQTSIPAMPGKEGFKTKEEAAKVAEIVIEKIKKGEMPPRVSVEEMKELKVIKRTQSDQLTHTILRLVFALTETE